MDIKEIFNKIASKENLTKEEMFFSLDYLTKNATNAQIGAFIMGMRLKEESIEEITYAALFFRDKALKVDIENPEDILDTCGTGGDRSYTINISTLASFVIAASGYKVAKHGNRALSSKCGSADLLEMLGAKIDLEPSKVRLLIEETNFGFMFAPSYHPIMKRVIGPRKELGIRSMFNLIGPLSNPAKAKRQLIGIYSKALVEKVANVLKNLGNINSYVVHGLDGIDEVSISGPTVIAHQTETSIKLFEFNPEDLSIKRRDLKELCYIDKEEILKESLRVLKGEESPNRDFVLLNAAFGISAASDKDLKESLEIAKESLFSGKALNTLNKFIELSHKL